MNEKQLPVTGGCLCGEVRYESTEPPINGGYCHCRMCQKSSGGLDVPWVEFASETFRFNDGPLKLYRSSEWGQRAACSTCGSHLAFLYDDEPAPVIMVGSLDHPGDWPLSQDGWWGHAYMDEKVPWQVVSDGMPQHASNYPEIPADQGGDSD